MTSLYAWGANSHGQLALGYESEMCKTPQEVSQLPSTYFIDNLAGISGGGGHCLFLDRNGLVYSCGWNNKGQLGINTTKNEAHITEIPSSTFNGANISYIEAGWDCSAAIDSTGELYLWGSNMYQQIGTAKTDVLIALTPRKTVLPGKEKCIKVQFGLRTACFVTKSCTYFVGISKAFNKFKTMNNVQLLQWNGIDYWKFDTTIVHIAGGQNHFTFCTDEFSGIQGFGDDKYSQSCTVPLNTNDTVNVLKSGWTHNGFLNQNGEVFLWGRNNYGQLGSDPVHTGNVINTVSKLNLKDEAVDLHLGAEHGLVVMKSGKVMTWGWNEHGNCGNNSEENLYTPAVVDLPGKCRLAGSGAGFCYSLVNY